MLDHIYRDFGFFFAESSRDWILDGAAVKVSMIGFGKRESDEAILLDGLVVSEINPDLTGSVRVFSAKQLSENKGLSFQGDKKDAPFEIPGEMAHRWLVLPVNPNGRPNSDVLRPWANGEDITGRLSGKWIIDFGMPLKPGSIAVPGMNHLTEAEAAFYEAPFTYAVETIKPAREAAAARSKGSAAHSVPWFCHARPRPEMRSAIFGLPRFLATVIHAKHRLFVWLPEKLVPSHSLREEGEDQLHEEAGRLHWLNAPGFQGLGQGSHLPGGFLGNEGDGGARSQLLRCIEEGSQQLQGAWVGQVGDIQLVGALGRVGEVRVDHQAVGVAHGQQGRVLQILAVTEQLFVGGTQVLALAFVFDGEEALLPDIGEAIGPIQLLGESFEAERLARRIHLGRCRVTHKVAEVKEVLLAGGALLQFRPSPFGGKRFGSHASSLAGTYAILTGWIILSPEPRRERSTGTETAVRKISSRPLASRPVHLI